MSKSKDALRERRRPLHFRHILALVILVLTTILVVFIQYLVTGDIVGPLAEGLVFVLIGVFLWKRWVRKERAAEKAAEEVRRQKLREVETRKEKPVEIVMTPPISRTHMVLLGVLFILLPIIFYIFERGLLSLVLMLFMIPLGILTVVGTMISKRVRFTVDSLGMRRTGVLLKDFYLPWFDIKKIMVEDMGIRFSMHGPRNYFLIAETNEGKKKFLVSSLAIGEDRFMQLCYDILPFIRNRRIEFVDVLRWDGFAT